MGKCLVCGKYDETYLCPECRKKLREDNPNYIDYQNALMHLADDLPEKERAYVSACILAYVNAGVYKADRQFIYDSFMDSTLDDYSEYEKLRIYGLLLNALWQDYMYDEAEEYANSLLIADDISYFSSISLGEYLTKTRRYKAAEEVLEYALNNCSETEYKKKKITELLEDNVKRYQGSFIGKNEYIPNPKEDKEEIQDKYFKFLSSVGIGVKKPVKEPKAIPINEYPRLAVTSKYDFDSFVAFDFETTGLNPKFDAIIEVGAIKVINGKIDESSEYIFSEFVKPYKKKVTPSVTSLTGITEDDVKNARQMWEVIPDFLEFAGDLPLVGYNNASFDNAFLERAGRHSNIVIKNKTFDVLTFIRNHRNSFGMKNCTLNDACKCFGVTNKRAHRAYSDATATAKVFLKAKKEI